MTKLHLKSYMVQFNEPKISPEHPKTKSKSSKNQSNIFQ